MGTSGNRDRRIKRLLLSISMATVAALASAIPAVAVPGEITEFSLARGIFPHGITEGPDRNLWFTEGVTSESSADRIASIAPSGQITEFPLPPGNNDPTLITSSPTGRVWFTESGKIGWITPEGQLGAAFSIPAPDNYVEGITVGPEGDIWFTERFGNIGRMTPSGQFTEFPVKGEPKSITKGPDGNLWFTLAVNRHSIVDVGGEIGRITPTGHVTTFPLSYGSGEPDGITSGPGGNLWFTAHSVSAELTSSAGRIGRITPRGQIREFSLPAGLDYPTEIAAGPDRHLWFTAPGYSVRFFDAGGIGAITPSGKATDFPSPNDRHGVGITSGPDGNLWFTAQGAVTGFYEPGISAIGRITSGLVDVSITSRRAVSLGHWARLGLECAGATNLVCRGGLRLRTTRGRLLASRDYALPAKEWRRRLAFRLNRRALSRLSRHPRLKAKATVTLAGGKGEIRQVSIRRRPTRRH
jgi:streptogramin lyase